MTHPLTTYRLRHGLSLRDVGARVGVTPATVWRWEAMMRAPHPRMIRKIVDAAGGELRVDDFFPDAMSTNRGDEVDVLPPSVPTEVTP